LNTGKGRGGGSRYAHWAIRKKRQGGKGGTILPDRAILPVIAMSKEKKGDISTWLEKEKKLFGIWAEKEQGGRQSRNFTQKLSGECRLWTCCASAGRKAGQSLKRNRFALLLNGPGGRRERGDHIHSSLRRKELAEKTPPIIPSKPVWQSFKKEKILPRTDLR